MTTSLTLRSVKGSPLTHDEVDANFTALRTTADGTRQLLTAPLDLYVRTDGSDSNNGLANTAGGAFLTIQKACDEAGKYVTSNYPVRVNIAAGTYAPVLPINVPGMVRGSQLDIVFVGDVATPANVVVDAYVNFNFGRVQWKGIQLQNYKYLSVGYAGQVYVDHCNVVSSYLACGYGGSFFVSNTTFSGDNFAALYAYSNGAIDVDSMTVSGTPDYSGAFVYAQTCAVVSFFAQPSGAATGKRYDASLNGVINTYGGGAAEIFHYGDLNASIAVSNQIQPRFAAGAVTITET